MYSHIKLLDLWDLSFNFLISSLLFDITSSLALFSREFGELYPVIILLSFSLFSPSHFNFHEHFYVLSMLGFFLKKCSHFIVAIYYFIALRYLQLFYLSCFLSCLHRLFSPNHFIGFLLLFVSFFFSHGKSAPSRLSAYTKSIGILAPKKDCEL